MEVVIYIALMLLLVLPIFLLWTKRASERLPPGSMGLPMIGHSLGLLKAMRANKGEQWLQERIRKYGPISKIGLFGSPSIFLHGQAANKFIYTCDGNMLASKQPASIRRIIGEKNILEMTGDDHKRVRAALISFLKPVNLPFTQFRRSLEARATLKPMLMDLINEKRLALEEHRASPDQDLITCLLNIRNEDNSTMMSDEEIIDNIVVVMVAGHDTTSILLTFLVRLLAENSCVYAAIVHEQEEIAKSKSSGELLTWDDLTKMKYTWLVAKETLRMMPPVFLSFRKALKDIEYGGYVIPKGWQVVWSATMTHMDEKIFPDPSRFDPTRFEQQSPALAFSFVAFGGGIRICPGYEFARMETLAMIHYLVTLFSWKFSLKDNSFSRNPMPVFNQGLPIKIEPKKSYD